MSIASRIPSVRRMYKFKKPSLIETEIAHLPESYKKFYKEWKLTPPEPVHYVPVQSEWIRNDETGEVKRQETVPIPVYFPKQSHEGIWGGEGVVKGFQKRDRFSRRVPHFWVPNLEQSVVYSEILNRRFSITITRRTIDLILDNYGFDNYILKTKACDLQSALALKLKREMLLVLFNKDLYPDDPIKAQDVYDKYKNYLSDFTREDIEWYGWTADEALRKWERESEVEPVPLKLKFRKEYLAELADPPEPADTSEIEESRSWIQKINPFGKK